MREFSMPLTVEIATTGNLTDDVVRNAIDTPDLVTFSKRGEEGWTDVTAAEFYADVVRVAKGLIGAGLQPGDRVAIFSKTRYEWTLSDYAIWFAGAVTVPIYETSSAEQVAWILQDSQARAVIAEGPDHVARVKEASTVGHEPEHVWSIADGGIDQIVELGGDITDEEVEARRTLAGPDDLATLIYTSGTTGHPKGCMLTHGNFMFELDVAVHELERIFNVDDASTLLFLPLAHVFARIIQIGTVKAGAKLGHSADIKNLLDDLAEFKPTFILGVPRVFEKVFNSASQKATADGKGAIFNKAADVAIAYSRALDTGKVGLVLRLQHSVFTKLVYSKLLAAMGGQCEFAISGGAPLGERLGHFFRGIGLTVLEGYGLTETTAALTVNLPGALKVGTVGRPLPGTTVRVADDGELQFKGGQVLSGYWQNQQATDQAFVDGWFHTGDLGEIDADGFVQITGRKKEILVTAGGKNVAPAVLEDRLRAHALIDQCMVVGDGKPFIAALITVDPEMLPAWAEAHGKPADLLALMDDPDFNAEIQSAIDDANKAVSKAESIRKFAILPNHWTEETGELTPSLKLRRNVVMRDFRPQVDALYL